MKQFKSYKDESKADWGQTLGVNENPSTDHIALGAQLRIADAVEKIAQNYQSLISERDYYQKRYAEQIERAAHLRRRISAMQGVATKLRKALEIANTK
jgi:hypothetical protein